MKVKISCITVNTAVAAGIQFIRWTRTVKESRIFKDYTSVAVVAVTVSIGFCLKQTPSMSRGTAGLGPSWLITRLQRRGSKGG